MAALAIAAACGGAADTDRAVLKRASDYPYANVYRFVDRVDAADVLECAAGVETITGVVDVDRSIAAFGAESRVFPEVIWNSAGSLVRATLLTGAPGDGWIMISADTPTSMREAAAVRMGTSLAAYAFSAALPAHPRDLASSAAKLSKTVEATRTSVTGWTVRAVVKDDVFGEFVGSNSVGEDLELRFTVDAADRIEEISVRSSATDGSGPSNSFGFVLTLDWSTDVAPPIVPRSATSIMELPAGGLLGVARERECALTS